MGKLITIVGNSGVGKTTLVKALCEDGRFSAFLENNLDRPFQSRFQDDLKSFALANQIDFLLFRAEQEFFIRENDIVGIQDGGLDQDFHIFTKRFHQRGYLTDDEFDLCDRFYTSLRKSLPLPDLIIKLSASYEILADRMRTRGREIDIAKEEDLKEIEKLLDEWFRKDDEAPWIEIDTREIEPSYSSIIDSLTHEILSTLNLDE